MAHYLDKDGLQRFFNGLKNIFALKNHTHSYAGSQSAGGAADKALSIPLAEIDSTSTSTVFTAQVPGITELHDGLCFYLHNGVVTSASGCTLNVNGLGAKHLYNASTAAVLTTAFAVNKVYVCWYDSTLASGGCWVVLTDNNTTYSYMANLGHGAPGGLIANSVVYRYQLLFQMDEDHVTPLNNVSNSTGTSKAMLTNVEFDPFGSILYYASSTTVNAGSRVGGGSAYYAGTNDCRYTFNCAKTLTAYKPLYLKVVLQANGKVKLATGTCWAQDLPTTNDGYYYIFLGRTYSTYQMGLYPWHPIYYHDGTQIREYVNPNKAIDAAQITKGTIAAARLPAASTSAQGAMSAADKTKLDGLKKALWVDMGTISSLPVTKTADGVTADMVCVEATLDTPSAQRSDWTINTDTEGSITVSGTISGTTTLKIVLVPSSSLTAT